MSDQRDNLRDSDSIEYLFGLLGFWAFGPGKDHARFPDSLNFFKSFFLSAAQKFPSILTGKMDLFRPFS